VLANKALAFMPIHVCCSVWRACRNETVSLESEECLLASLSGTPDLFSHTGKKRKDGRGERSPLACAFVSSPCLKAGVSTKEL
jgi:hypothetical protein